LSGKGAKEEEKTKAKNADLSLKSSRMVSRLERVRAFAVNGAQRFIAIFIAWIYRM